MPAELTVNVNQSYALEFECPECGALVEFLPGDERVECVDYDDMPVGCGTEFLLGDPSVVVHWAPAKDGEDR